MKAPDELSLIYIGRRDSSQSPAGCEGCYFHRISGAALCAAGGKARCAVPVCSGMAYDYYIYQEKEDEQA